MFAANRKYIDFVCDDQSSICDRVEYFIVLLLKRKNIYTVRVRNYQENFEFKFLLFVESVLASLNSFLIYQNLRRIFFE